MDWNSANSPLSLNHRAPETATSVQGGKKAAKVMGLNGGSQSRMSAPTRIMFPCLVSPCGCCISTQ
ncbi:MAG: hypothetical protein ACLSAH_18500 [Bilophila wadsworthia]